MTPATVNAGFAESTSGAAGLRVLEAGSGAPVVLVHGLAGGAENWALVAPELAHSHRVLVPDLPGHGGSPPLAGSVTTDSLAHALAGTLDELSAGPALLAGHSLGALVSVRLALLRPDLVRAALLICPPGISTQKRVSRMTVQASVWLRPGRAVAPLRHRLSGSAWFRRAVFWPYYAWDTAALSAEAMCGFLEPLSRHSDLAGPARGMLADDPRVELPGISCPTLLLWGARDLQVPLGDAFDWARRLRAPLRLVPDCGHLMPGERPEAVLAAVRDLERAE
jgi:pimeloyl-ACP methyl ester carboxylesterase